MEPSHSEDGYGLFVSYARADDGDGWVTRLVEAIGEVVGPDALFFDRKEIRSMDDWRQRIHVGLNSARMMLAVVSPAYFQSEWCRRECEAYLEREQALGIPGDGIAPIYIRTCNALEKALKSDTGDPWAADLAARQLCDVRGPDGDGPLPLEHWKDRLDELAGQLARRIEQIRQSLASPSTLPPHNPQFVGRRNELRRLAEMLTAGSLGAITAWRRTWGSN